MNISLQPKQILLISSRSDPAGSLIHEEINSLLGTPAFQHLAPLYLHEQVDERLIYLDGPSLGREASLILFLSRHASKEHRSVLTVHMTGNFDTAELGGRPHTLSAACPRMMHALLRAMAAEAPEGYEVTFEATHHGPTGIQTPSCFVEIGSSEKEWHDRTAAAAVARSILAATPDPGTITLAGFGGTHYAKRQTEISLTTRGAFGHIVPARDIHAVDRAGFADIIRAGEAEAVYIDKKSLSGDDVHRLEEYASSLQIPILGQSDLSRLGNLPFPEYLAILRLAHEVHPGSSLTLHALNSAPDPVVFTISREILGEVEKTEQSAFDERLEGLPVAHLSGDGIAHHQEFIADKADAAEMQAEITDLCIHLLYSHFGTGIRQVQTGEGNLLLITEERFNPEKAIALGLKPGKEFGILAAGRPVTVGERTVTPEQVMTRHERSIRIDEQNSGDI